ncbi:hypothetical protein E3Q23_04462 [Wallemia mellicola]|uniref:Uncharacterized protein n=1 Tax=Wallemia mellicola TaxID=1708541 RepID=A0A4T0T7M5_9BASI|nr:hypothetical protein E3Q23_04462 [Wallemia mellicola]TIC28711.1 hypothetical protein E3Q09_04414 [Wallemia mellicola]TIC48320.1 hypothetical protein E3Q04_04469 [Wallemia mellicola]TIC60378.1 hypothetical protein E3Q01_04472 [Wallemia mellicola]
MPIIIEWKPDNVIFSINNWSPVSDWISTKHDFLQSRPEKDLLYYLNATGNSNYDKGGNSFDVMRVMTDDVALDLDERYPVLHQGETVNESQYIQQEECQNTDTELDIQHHLITSDKKGQAITHRYSCNNNGYGQEKRMYGQQQ